MQQPRWMPLLVVCLFALTAATLADDLGYKETNQFGGMQIATTYWDRQHPASVGRMIAQDRPDTIHFVWTERSVAGGIAYAQYQALFRYGSGWSSFLPPGGYQVTTTPASALNAVTFQNRMAAVYHTGVMPFSRPSQFALDWMTALAIFTYSSIPTYSCSHVVTGPGEDAYSWPKIAVEESATPDPIFHVITTEDPLGGGQMLSLVYHRGVGDPPNFGTCGIFIDSVLTDAAVICQDPVSSRVAIVYLCPRNKNASVASNADNDVAYVLSYDQGITWQPRVNVTNHLDIDPERAFPELTAMFTTQGTLHIAWVSTYFDYVTQLHELDRCKLMHWDTYNILPTAITWADNVQGCYGGFDVLNIAKPCLSECDNRIYVTYVRFEGDLMTGTEDCSQLGWANGDLHVKASETGGVTWGPAVNISNTRTHLCAPGACESENWPSVVEQCDDSLRIFYVGDTDAGAFADGANEGSETACSMMFQSIPCFAMDLLVELHVVPDDFATTPFELEVSQSADTTFEISNRGNANGICFLHIEYLTGSPGWLSVYPTWAEISPLFPGEFTVSAIAFSAGDYTARIVIQNNGGDDIIIPVALHSAAAYKAGDASGDGTVNISDAVYLIAYIFAGGDPPDPMVAGDANCDGPVNISDAVYLIAYIFAGGSAPCED